jgi:uncharacterized protein YuzE
MKDFKVFYDEEQDVLYLGKEAREREAVELAPGVRVELDKSGGLLALRCSNPETAFDM